MQFFSSGVWIVSLSILAGLMSKGANTGYKEEKVFEKVMDQDFKGTVKGHPISNIYLSEEKQEGSS